MTFFTVVRRRYLLHSLLATALFSVCGTASANFTCSGKVQSIGTDNSLFINIGYGVHRMCSLSEDRCKAWLSIAMAAKMAEKSINVYYQSNGGLTSSYCASIGNWVDPTTTPVYFIEIY